MEGSLSLSQLPYSFYTHHNKQMQFIKIYHPDIPFFHHIYTTWITWEDQKHLIQIFKRQTAPNRGCRFSITANFLGLHNLVRTNQYKDDTVLSFYIIQPFWLGKLQDCWTETALLASAKQFNTYKKRTLYLTFFLQYKL